MAITNLIAIDLGASSGRLISGQYDGQTVTLKEQFRFSNHPVDINGRLYWDYLKIFQEIKYGLSIAMKDLGHIDGINIDTWGVDYGLLTARGELAFAPHSYRDTRTATVQAEFERRMPLQQLFEQVGNQPDTINTNIQMFADITRYPFLKEEVAHILMMPDLVGYFLTGKMASEFTIASTTGLLDVKTRQWNQTVLDQLGLPRAWFGELVTGGKVLGAIRPEICAELQLNQDATVITGVGHDTAAALLALPIAATERQHAAFISCGTWSIVGRATEAPVVNATAYAAGLTNEGCFDGTNRLLQNTTGLWIIQELQSEWSYQGEMVEFGKMTQEAIDAESIGSYIDPNTAIFATPGQMTAKIKRFLTVTNQTQPQTRGELVRVVLESLALTYRRALEALEQVGGGSISEINMFGGGIQNQLLVSLTADYTGKVVATGPTEASVMGNIVSQLQTLGLLKEAETPAVMAASFDVKRVTPQPVTGLNEIAARFDAIVEAAQTQDFGTL